MSSLHSAEGGLGRGFSDEAAELSVYSDRLGNALKERCSSLKSLGIDFSFAVLIHYVVS